MRKRPRNLSERPGTYIALIMTLIVTGVSCIWAANQRFAPEMYSRSGSVTIAEALSKNQNYALFDLNINIREIRDEQIRRMAKAPEVVVLGASHWQEAHVDLLPDHDFYNAHVHRDYYEDMLGMTEIFLRHGKLPQKMIITVRDNLFTPLSERKDHLWLPILPYYKVMAKRLGLPPHGMIESMPMQRWRELLSLSMLHGNMVRWYTANEKPHATEGRDFEGLDVLLPGGSILWSRQHKEIFSQERARQQALTFAMSRIPDPPRIDPKGVHALDTLLAFLKSKNVEVYLAHPPFNPLYIDRVMAPDAVSTATTTYRDGLAKVEAVTRELAEKHGLSVIGGFDGRKFDCAPEVYIDAEHAAPGCLGRVLAEFAAIDAARHGAPARRDNREQTVGEHLTTAGPAAPGMLSAAMAVPAVQEHKGAKGRAAAKTSAAAAPAKPASPLTKPRIVNAPAAGAEVAAEGSAPAVDTAADQSAAGVPATTTAAPLTARSMQTSAAVDRKAQRPRETAHRVSTAPAPAAEPPRRGARTAGAGRKPVAAAPQRRSPELIWPGDQYDWSRRQAFRAPLHPLVK